MWKATKPFTAADAEPSRRVGAEKKIQLSAPTLRAAPRLRR
ncbi:MAG TPA: hypothetical protein VGO96_20675 [Pyrinomonadaceae bacterium]|nr:hypothetical protein [Pyrinomonadaceae bacterium]